MNLLKFINLIRKATAIIIIQCSIKKGDVVYVVTISPNPSNSKASKQQNNYSINVSPFLSKILNQYKNQKITILTNTKGYFALTEDGKVTLVLKTPRNNEKNI